jgi:hypothetical protein
MPPPPPENDVVPLTPLHNYLPLMHPLFLFFAPFVLISSF